MDVDIDDYAKSDPLSYDKYNMYYWDEQYTMIETPLDKLPYKIKEIVPMANMRNIPNYVVDMGIIVRTEEPMEIGIAVIDKEGRYFGLTQTTNYKLSSFSPILHINRSSLCYTVCNYQQPRNQSSLYCTSNRIY